MFFTSVLVATAALSGFAVAQNDSSANLPPGIQPCCTVDANLVPEEMRRGWCLAQRNTCPELCGGVNQLASGGQGCDPETLEWECECRNGTIPQMEDYQQSVPGQMCRFWYDQCINATNENLEYQVECQNQRDTMCGNLTTSDPEETESPTGSSTPTGTATDGPEETGASESDPAPSPTGAAALVMTGSYGTPLLVGGLAAFFGLAL